MQGEPLIPWPRPVYELLEFVAAFLALGPLGFRFVVARPGAWAGAELDVRTITLRRAAPIGVVGAVLALAQIALVLPGLAARRHTDVVGLVAADPLVAARILLMVLAALGFVLAWRGLGAGWALAAGGVVGSILRNVVNGDWTQLVNPLHLLSGGLWIGTLFVLVVAGLATVMTLDSSSERRGELAASMVNAFSPLALAAGTGVVLFGLVTAWRHLKPLPALWTTPYGYALLVKLVLVAAVFSLGAWNWRRQRPRLGSASAATGLRRSAWSELVAAGLVLLATAILVSLPSPRH
jgi:putative copper export protein